MIKARIRYSGLLLLPFMAVFLFFSNPIAEASEYGDIYLDATRESMKKADVGAVIFPHWFHRIRYKCKVCHETIFVMRKGANKISMREIMDGRYCGVCHNGQIAWEALECKRCHNAEFTPAADKASPEAETPAAAAAVETSNQ